MKKKYISPESITVRLAMTQPIAGSLTPEGATFYDKNATGEGMVKSLNDNIFMWSDEW